MSRARHFISADGRGTGSWRREGMWSRAARWLGAGVLLGGAAMATAAAPNAPACASVTEPALLSAHPLVGVWRGLDTVSPVEGCADVFASAREADVVFLGEAHGHPEHHRLQQAWIEGLAGAGREPIVAMEIFDVEDQGKLDAWRAEGRIDADALAAAVGMESRDWDWPLYRPIVASALEHGWRLVAINLSSEQARAVAMEGHSASELVAPLDRPGAPLREEWDESVASTWLDRAWESHCRMIPREHMGGFLLAQRARDAVMANRIDQARAAASTRGREPQVVVVTGSEHARRDIGVPAYFADDVAVFSIALREVRDAALEPLQYRLDGFDAVAFTVAIPRPDPCESFSARR